MGEGGGVYINPTGERARDDICFSGHLSFSERPRPSLHSRLGSPQAAVLKTFMIRAVNYFPRLDQKEWKLHERGEVSLHPNLEVEELWLGSHKGVSQRRVRVPQFSPTPDSL